MTQKVAFVGLGNMGGGMAANLAKAGFNVHVFDVPPRHYSMLWMPGVSLPIPLLPPLKGLIWPEHCMTDTAKVRK